MKKFYLIFILLFTSFSVFSGNALIDVGTGVRLENFHVNDFEFMIFGIDNSNKASFRVYNLQGNLIRSTQFGNTEKDWLQSSLRAMDVDGNKIVCVYVEDNQKTIITKTSTDGGNNWSTKNSYSTAYNIKNIDICLYNDYLYLAYIDDQGGSSGKERIMFGKMSFTASVWSIQQIYLSSQDPNFFGIGIDVVHHGGVEEYIHIFNGHVYFYFPPNVYTRTLHHYSTNGGASFSLEVSDEFEYDHGGIQAGLEVDMASGSYMTLAVLKHDVLTITDGASGFTFTPNSSIINREYLETGYNSSVIYNNDDDEWYVYKSFSDQTPPYENIVFKKYDPVSGWDASWTTAYNPSLQPKYIIGAYDNGINFVAFGNDNGGYSNNVFYNDTDAPAAPQNLQQVATYGQSARLTWDANAEPDLRRYRIFRKSDMYGTWEARAYTTATSWTDPEVIIGPPMTTWYWKIKSQDWAWNSSDYSNTVSAIGLIKPAVNNPDEIPDTYMITQNYPNPFNPTTTISFDLPEDTFVKMIVYDVSGKLVAILVNNQLSAGSYNVNFDASHLPSGLYFYKISAGLFSQIMRMLLIK